MKQLPTFIIAIVVCILVHVPATLADELYFDDMDLGKPTKEDDGVIKTVSRNISCGVYWSKTWPGGKTVKHFYIYYTAASSICIQFWETSAISNNPKELVVEGYFGKHLDKLSNFSKQKEFKTDYLSITYVGFTFVPIGNCFGFTSIKNEGGIRSSIRGIYCGRNDSERAFKANLGKLRFKIQPPVHSNNTKSGDDNANEPDRSTPSTSQSSDDIEIRLRKLKQFEAEGLISKEDYDRKRQELLDKL